MRLLWWSLKLLAGLVLVGCVLLLALAVVFPPLTERAGNWLAVFVLSAVVYAVAHAALGPPARPPAAADWQGHRHVVPAPWLRQGTVCLVLGVLGVGIPWVFLRDGSQPPWQVGLALLGGLLGLWLSRAAVIGFLNMRRAGYALQLDASGVHYPGQPLLPWTQVAGLALEPPRPDSDRTTCLVLQLRSAPERPAGLRALWQAALPGARITRDAISLPLPTMRRPGVVLEAAQALWRRHGGGQ